MNYNIKKVLKELENKKTEVIDNHIENFNTKHKVFFGERTYYDTTHYDIINKANCNLLEKEVSLINSYHTALIDAEIQKFNSIKKVQTRHRKIRLWRAERDADRKFEEEPGEWPFTFWGIEPRSFKGIIIFPFWVALSPVLFVYNLPWRFFSWVKTWFMKSKHKPRNYFDVQYLRFWSYMRSALVFLAENNLLLVEHSKSTDYKVKNKKDIVIPLDAESDAVFDALECAETEKIETVAENLGAENSDADTDISSADSHDSPSLSSTQLDTQQPQLVPMHGVLDLPLIPSTKSIHISDSISECDLDEIFKEVANA